MNFILHAWEWILMIVSVIVGFFVFSRDKRNGESPNSDRTEELDNQDADIQEREQKIREQQNQDEELLNQLESDRKQIQDELNQIGDDAPEGTQDIRDWINGYKNN